MSPKRLSTRQGYSQNTHKCIPGEQVVTSKIRNTTTTNTVRYKCTFLKIGCYFRRRFARVRSASLMVEILLLGFFHVLSFLIHLMDQLQYSIAGMALLCNEQRRARLENENFIQRTEEISTNILLFSLIVPPLHFLPLGCSSQCSLHFARYGKYSGVSGACFTPAYCCLARCTFLLCCYQILCKTKNETTHQQQFVHHLVSIFAFHCSERESREYTSCFLKMSSSTTTVVGNDYDDGPTIFGTCLFVKKVCSTLSM